MTKNPVWAKDTQGKFKPFPHKHLVTFDDGERGFTLLVLLEHWQELYPFIHAMKPDYQNNRILIRESINEDTSPAMGQE